jgi:hypothetical protein
VFVAKLASSVYTLPLLRQATPTAPRGLARVVIFLPDSLHACRTLVVLSQQAAYILGPLLEIPKLLSYGWVMNWL